MQPVSTGTTAVNLSSYIWDSLNGYWSESATSLPLPAYDMQILNGNCPDVNSPTSLCAVTPLNPGMVYNFSPTFVVTSSLYSVYSGSRYFPVTGRYLLAEVGPMQTAVMLAGVADSYLNFSWIEVYVDHGSLRVSQSGVLQLSGDICTTASVSLPAQVGYTGLVAVDYLSPGNLAWHDCGGGMVVQ